MVGIGRGGAGAPRSPWPTERGRESVRSSHPIRLRTNRLGKTRYEFPFQGQPTAPATQRLGWEGPTAQLRKGVLGG